MRSLAVASLAALLIASTATAQNYPTRPIRLIVPFSPGGGTDINARILQDPLGNALGQTIVVDNRPGAGSILGTDLAAHASPDGYTILLCSASVVVNGVVFKNLPYDTRRDLAPITTIADQPSLMVVNPSLAAKDLKQFISLVQASPGKYTYGVPGIGTITHLGTILLLSKFKGNMIAVPFKGTGPALTSLIGGEISMYMSTFASALPHVKNGRLRALAVSGATRAGPLPEVPTISEAGVPGYVHLTWYGIVAPGKTPTAILNKLNTAIVSVLKSKEVGSLYEKQGLNPVPMTRAQFTKYINDEFTKWEGVVRDARIPRRTLGGR